jgi:uncharacterized membrane protein YfcA
VCTQTSVVGTSLLALLPPSCTGLLQHWRLGNVDWRMAAGLAFGTAFGSLTGSNLAVHAPPGMSLPVFSPLFPVFWGGEGVWLVLLRRIALHSEGRAAASVLRQSRVPCPFAATLVSWLVLIIHYFLVLWPVWALSTIKCNNIYCFCNKLSGVWTPHW